MMNALRTIPIARASAMIVGLLLLGFYAAADPVHPQLPGEVAMSPNAGRGKLLFVALRLESGEELPFLVDTGAIGTVFDKSLEPKLGKRLGSGTTENWSGKGGKANFYAARRLYLGNTPLMTGDKIWTGDLERPSGILGMDCLKHYCIQLDFQAGKMRFLNPEEVNAADLGKAFPLTFKGNLPFIHHAGLLGASGTNLLIDVGCRIDGLEEKNAIKGLAQILPERVWEGETYTDLTVAAVEHANALGLNFFARHLVTFDFPRRIMYLKQISAGPLPGDSSMEIANNEMGAPAEFLEHIKENGQLPGLAKEDMGATYIEAYSNFDSKPINATGVGYVKAYFTSRHKSVSFNFWKNGDSSIYHYHIARVSTDSPWKLQRAWRTDENEHTIEEYPVP